MTPNRALLLHNGVAPTEFGLPPLAGVRYDAEAMARALKACGFEVIVLESAGRETIKKRLEELTQSGSLSLLTVYFSGHAQGRKLFTCAHAGQCPTLTEICAMMARLGAARRLVILDVCRQVETGSGQAAVVEGLSAELVSATELPLARPQLPVGAIPKGTPLASGNPNPVEGPLSVFWGCEKEKVGWEDRRGGRAFGVFTRHLTDVLSYEAQNEHSRMCLEDIAEKTAQRVGQHTRNFRPLQRPVLSGASHLAIRELPKLKHFASHIAVAESDEGVRIAVSDGRYILTWKGEEPAKVVDCLQDVVGLNLHADKLAVATGGLPDRGSDPRFHRFRSSEQPNFAEARQMDGPVIATAMSVQGRHIAISMRSGEFMLFEAVTDDGRASGRRRICRFPAECLAVAFSATGRVACALANGEIALVDYSDMNDRSSLSYRTMRANRGEAPITGIAFTSNATTMVTTDLNGRLKLWRGANQIESIQCPDPITSFAYGPDDWLAVGLAGGGVRIYRIDWDRNAFDQFLDEIKDPNSEKSMVSALCFSPSRDTLFWGLSDGSLYSRRLS